MSLTPILGPIALSVALIALGMAVVKHRGAWRTPDALIPLALVLITIQWLVPLPDSVQISLAILSLMISVSGMWQISRRRRSVSID